MKNMQNYLLNYSSICKEDKKLYNLVYTIDVELQTLFRLYHNTKNKDIKSYLEPQIDLLIDLKMIIEEGESNE